MKNFNYRQFWKAIGGACVASVAAITAAASDNNVTVIEWVIFGLSTVGGFAGVYAMPANEIPEGPSEAM